jgi:Rrf2 family transcriptional regulator, nitric oxide-sensitive transcriptional repressor
MLKITRKLEYSLMVLRHTASKYQGELTTAKEVSDTYKTPFDVTSKVMQNLAQKGLLKSEQGAYGGYLLLKDLSKVSLFELIEIVEGPVAIVKCLNDGPASCDMSSSCNIISPVQALNDRLIEFYKNLSVLDLIGSQSKRPLRAPNRMAGVTS